MYWSRSVLDICVWNSDNCPNSEHAGIQMEATCPKTELVQYSDSHCTNNTNIFGVSKQGFFEDYSTGKGRVEN